MRRFSRIAAINLALLALAGCGASPHGAPPHEASSASGPQAFGTQTPGSREQLNAVLERYWEEHTPVEDLLSPQSLADSLAVEKKYLSQLLSIERASLDDDARLSYDIFKRQRETAIEGFTYPSELLPIDPFGGLLSRLLKDAAQTATNSTSAAQYEAWLRSLDEYTSWMRQAILNMKDGVLRGYTSPRAVIERALPILETIGTDSPENVLFGPLRTFPSGMADADRQRLTVRLNEAIRGKLLPSVRALHDYLLHTYLPQARPGLGLAELPLGSAWYAYLVRRAAGVDASAADIHRMGLTEAERLRTRLQALREARTPSVPDAGTPATPDASSKSDVLIGYENLDAKVTTALPALFSVIPPGSYELRPVDFIWSPATVLEYRPPPPGSGQSGILYVNTRETVGHTLTSAFLRQVLPGRRYQDAIQRQRLDLPRFRRFDAEPSFIWGWELYAASLGEELGVYVDDEDRFQALNFQMRCAVTLVIDTGLHSMGWTRAQAVEYLRAQMNIDDGEARTLIDSSAAAPGRGLSSTMGALRFHAIRSRAQQTLGARFDPREFHTEILRDGAMPLDILDAKMALWMEASR